MKFRGKAKKIISLVIFAGFRSLGATWSGSSSPDSANMPLAPWNMWSMDLLIPDRSCCRAGSFLHGFQPFPKLGRSGQFSSSEAGFAGDLGLCEDPGKGRHGVGRWRAGVHGAEEEGDLPVHIALEIRNLSFLKSHFC